MQGRQRQSVANLEGSSDLTKEQCKIGELRRFLGALVSSLAHTIESMHREQSTCLGGLWSSSLHTEEPM
jgi:hypothetical protein